MIDLSKVIDLKDLQNIQDQFSNATGLAAIAVDAQGNYITNGSNFTDFCMKYTRGTQEGLRRCVKCDRECTGTYFCHAGLMDFSSDIIIAGERVGAIIGGQVLPNPPDENQFRQIARELGVNEDAYIEAIRRVPVRTEKVIRAAAELLGDIVNQLVNLNYLEKINSHKTQSFDKEMDIVQQGVSTIMSKTGDLKRVASMERILALNASVEAARAGNAGVGFAVIAREIGELSSNSSEVYDEIESTAKCIKTSVEKINHPQFNP